MRDREITQWLTQAKRKLEGGPGLSNLIDQLSIYFSFGEKDAVVKLLENKNIDLPWINQRGMTSLMQAAEYGNTDAVELLIAAGANPELRDKYGWTAYHYALDNLRNTFPKKSQIRLFELLAQTQEEREQIIKAIRSSLEVQANNE